MKLRAVLFDLWGTLIVDHDSVSRPRQVWRAENVVSILRERGLNLSFDTVDTALVRAGAALSELHDEGIDVDSPGRVGLFLQQLEPEAAQLVASDVKPALEKAITSMHEVYRPSVAEGAIEVLQVVKEMGLGTALVSNAGFTTAPNLRQMLDSYGLAPYIDVLVFSDDLQLAKPDRRVFDAALGPLRVEPGAAAFVGDSPHNDVYGAKAAGMLAVQIGRREHTSRSGYSEHHGVEPDARIDRFEELLPALGIID